MNYLDTIYNFYKDIDKKPSYPTSFKNLTLINANTGIGDALSLYIIDSPIKDNHIKVIVQHPSIVQELAQYNNYIPTINHQHNWYSSIISVLDIQSYSNFGGHFLQKNQQFLGLDIDIIPRPRLSSNTQIKSNKVVMTFDKGAVYQQHLHPRARIIYEESKQIIQTFINNHKHQYHFVEVGKYSLGLDNVENKTNIGIRGTTDEIASCEYFFGNHNGLMHIAAGLQKKSIIIVNFPSAKDIILPCLKKVNIPDIDWLYPQNIHLHQDYDGPLVKKLTYENIQKAFNGQIYPYFSDMYLCDTFEHLNY
jgi:hypothetical protein